MTFEPDQGIFAKQLRQLGVALTWVGSPTTVSTTALKLAGPALDSAGLVSKQIAGTQVLFDGVAAPIVYVSATTSSVIVPYSVAGLFVLAALCSLALATTRFGAHLYAVGGNAEGARLAGIRTDLVTISAHVVCSLMAGLSGLYLASRLRSGAPWVGRDGVYDLESIAVVVIGGTLLAGGRGGVWGTLAGVLLFATLDAAFNMMGVSAYPKLVLRGATVAFRSPREALMRGIALVAQEVALVPRLTVAESDRAGLV